MVETKEIRNDKSKIDVEIPKNPTDRQTVGRHCGLAALRLGIVSSFYIEGVLVCDRTPFQSI